MRIISTGFNEIRDEIIVKIDNKIHTDCLWLIYNVVFSKVQFEVIIEVENEVGRQILNQLQSKFNKI